MAIIYQICLGPHLPEAVAVAPGLSALPLPSVGCGDEIAFIERFLDHLGVRAGGGESLQAMGRRFKPAMALKYEWDAPLDRGVDDLLAEAEPTLERARHVVGVLTGEAYEPLTTIATHQARPDEIVFPVRLPRIRGIHAKRGPLVVLEGPARSEAEILFDAFGQDARLERLATLYQIATVQEQPIYRIAQLYMCLVAIASGISNRPDVAKDADAARMAAGYGYTERFAIFQVEGRSPFALDHIGVARKVRDHVYHAGTLEARDLRAFTGGWDLLEAKPDLIAFALASDCLRLLHGWPAGHLASRAQAGEEVDLPDAGCEDRWPRWHFHGQAKPGGVCAGARIESVAADGRLNATALLSTLVMTPEDKPGIAVRSGRGAILEGEPLGYEMLFGGGHPEVQ